MGGLESAKEGRAQRSVTGGRTGVERIALRKGVSYRGCRGAADRAECQEWRMAGEQEAAREERLMGDGYRVGGRRAEC